jgi:uncharacterized LabA/DUF88 family protein
VVYNFERLKANQDSLLLEVKHLQAELKQAMETQESHVPAYRGKVQQLQQEQRELKLKVASIEQQVGESNNSFVLPVKKSKPQRKGTAIFVDQENLYHCAKEKGMDIDLNKILSLVADRSARVNTHLYAGRTPYLSNQRQLQGYRSEGYRVITKDITQRPDGSWTANLDGEMARDMHSLSGEYENYILMSGDGDFVATVMAVQLQGVEVTVVGFRSNTSRKLIQVADRFVDLEFVKAA